MRHRLIGFVAAALAAGLLAGPAAQAQQGPPNQPSQQGPRMGRFQQKLGLTDDQMTVIRDAYTKHRDAQRQIYGQLRTVQTQMRLQALNGQDTRGLQTQVQTLLAQSMQLRLQALQEIGPHLTSDQREALAKLGPGGGWMRHRHPHGQPQTQPSS